MGTGVPYAIASKLARPDKRVIAVLGDYAFGASAMELETAARMGLDLVFVVANNQGIVGRSMQEALYEPSGQPVASLLPARYELLAEMVGGHGEAVERVDDLVPALRRACDSPGVAVVNVVMDPHDHGFYASSDYLTGGYTIREPSIRYGD
jgi:thiamine pyrophosphate-dependent acetolactate synthase large subunit-like protein